MHVSATMACHRFALMGVCRTKQLNRLGTSSLHCGLMCGDMCRQKDAETTNAAVGFRVSGLQASAWL